MARITQSSAASGQRIVSILNALKAHYQLALPPPKPFRRSEDLRPAGAGRGDQKSKMLWDRGGREAFQVLIGTILSQRTRDSRTAAASEALFARYPTASALARAPLAEVRRLVKPANFYKTKARTVRKAAQAVLADHSGRVPLEREALLAIPGVGPKTAACVLVYGHQLPAIPVDTHVHRISNRLGLVATKTPEDTERALEQLVPKPYWRWVNELFVRHGQALCKPIGPRCGECPLAGRCPTGQQRLGK
ncbi:MAG TPA: endonuclease III [archaeon]|nr:endonuclease III [archaeon]